MSALRAARGFTGPRRHREIRRRLPAATADAFSSKPEAARRPSGLPIPPVCRLPSVAEHGDGAPCNDPNALRDLSRAEGGRIAAVIVEARRREHGCVPPEPGFLEAIVDLCAKHGAVSIFDEVMTGSATVCGRRAAALRLKPDMTCLGKVVGGGMPLAVYRGPRGHHGLDCAAWTRLPSRYAQRQSARRERWARDARAPRRRRVFAARSARRAAQAGLRRALSEAEMSRRRSAGRVDAHRVPFTTGPFALGPTLRSRIPGASAFSRTPSGARDLLAAFAVRSCIHLCGTHGDDDIDRTVLAAREALAPG